MENFNQEARDTILTYYNPWISKFSDVRAGAWGRSEMTVKQIKENVWYRFGLLIQESIEGSLLDIGCGKGFLADYLKEKGINVKYTGVDINPRAVEGARELHPDFDFREADILETDLGSFDFVVASGLFCVNTGENCKADTKNILKKMAEMAKKYMAANFMDASKCSFFEGHLNYEDPENIRKFLSEFGHVEILRDYPMWEFTAKLRINPL